MENKTNAKIGTDEIEAESSATAVPVEVLEELVLDEVEVEELSVEVELVVVKESDGLALEDFKELEDLESLDDIVVDKEPLVVMVMNPEVLEVDPELISATLKIPL